MSQFQPGLCSVTLKDYSVGDVVATASRLGLSAIEWSSRAHIKPGDVAGAAQARQLCEQNHILPVSYGCYLRGVPDEEEEVGAVIATARELGADNLRVWAGNELPGKTSATDWMYCVNRLREYADLAGEAGMTLGFEFHVGTLTDTPQSTIDLIDCVRRPNLFTYWQPRPRFFDVDKALKELTEVHLHLSHLHVFYGDHMFEQFPLKDGAAYWQRLLGGVSPSPKWSKPSFAFLELVRDWKIEQLEADATVLREII